MIPLSPSLVNWVKKGNNEKLKETSFYVDKHCTKGKTNKHFQVLNILQCVDI